MKEVDFSCDEMNAFVEKVRGYFAGIDSIIAELETERDTLAKEKATLDLEDDFTAATLKRKATIGNDIKTVELALKQAQEERSKIQERYWTEIGNESRTVESALHQKINAQLTETAKEIDDLLIEASKKVSFIKEVKTKENAVFNSGVVHPINEVVRSKHSTPNSKVLSPSFSVFVDDLEKRLNKLKSVNKIKK